MNTPMIDAVLEIPRRFAFSEVAHARHYSSILDTALAYSQHWLRRDDKVRWFFIYLTPSAGVTLKEIRHCCES